MAKEKRYPLDAETETWLVNEAIATESDVPRIIARLVKKEKNRRGGGTLQQGLSSMYAVSTGNNEMTRGA